MRYYPLWFRRSVALGLLGALLMVVGFVIVKPYYADFLAQQEKIERLSNALMRYNSRLATRDDLDDHVKKLHGKLSTAGVLRHGKTRASIAAQIQSQVRSALTRLGGRVLSTVDLPIDKGANKNRVSVRVRCQGSISVLTGFLYASETELPRVLIENISIKASELTHANIKKERQLTFVFDAYGYAIEGG